MNKQHDPRTVCELDGSELEQASGGLYSDGSVKSLITMLRLIGKAVV
jgi:hypothetical protein